MGTFEVGKKNGVGEFIWVDGRRFVGTWKDGKLDGEGILKLPNGEEKVGKWDEGKTLKLIKKKIKENT